MFPWIDTNELYLKIDTRFGSKNFSLAFRLLHKGFLASTININPNN